MLRLRSRPGPANVFFVNSGMRSVSTILQKLGTSSRATMGSSCSTTPEPTSSAAANTSTSARRPRIPGTPYSSPRLNNVWDTASGDPALLMSDQRAGLRFWWVAEPLISTVRLTTPRAYTIQMATGMRFTATRVGNVERGAASVSAKVIPRTLRQAPQHCEPLYHRRRCRHCHRRERRHRVQQCTERRVRRIECLVFLWSGRRG